MNTNIRSLVSVGLLATLAAVPTWAAPGMLNDKPVETTNTNSNMPGTPSATPQTQAKSDNEILKIIKTANEAQIYASQLATTRARHENVKTLAKSIVSDFDQNNKDEKKVESNGVLVPEASSESQSMDFDSKQKYSELKKLHGVAFDKAYVANQVEVQEQLLKDINDNFIPSANDPNLRFFLKEMSARVQEDLGKAKDIQTKL